MQENVNDADSLLASVGEIRRTPVVEPSSVGSEPVFAGIE